MSVMAWSTEDVVDAAITTLSTQLGPALDAIYAARADVDEAAGRSIDYSAPRPGLSEVGGDYYAGAASTIIRYPAVEVALPDLNLANFDLAKLNADATENLVVVLWEQATQMTVLYRKLTRLAAAAYQVLIPDNAIGGATAESVRGAWRWNPEANQRDEITSGALLVFSLSSTLVAP